MKSWTIRETNPGPGITTEIEKQLNPIKWPLVIVMPSPPYALGKVGAAIAFDPKPEAHWEVARLIVAVPDLLAVLAESRQFVAAWTANHESKIGERMLRKIDTALDKAAPAS